MIQLYPEWLIDSEQLFKSLRTNVEWSSRTIHMFGRVIDVPRLESWNGVQGATYSYSGQKYVAKGWAAGLLVLVKRLRSEFSWQPNGALLNYYRNGNDSMGWHSDDEKELGQSPTVAIVSLGCTRKIVFRQKENNRIKLSVNLASGSLLIMQGLTQQNWQHSLPKCNVEDERISLTFREVFN